MKKFLTTIIPITILVLFIATILVKNSKSSPKDILSYKASEVINEKENNEDQVVENKCKYPFYAQQAVTAAEWSKTVAEELMFFLEVYPNLNKEERELFEEDKLIMTDCYKALSDWNESISPNNEGDYRRDCHFKILIALESNKNTLDYLSKNPHSFDKALVRKNLSQVIEFVSSYFELEEDRAKGIITGRNVECTNLLILNY